MIELSGLQIDYSEEEARLENENIPIEGENTTGGDANVDQPTGE
jgi:hypothetical protein